MSTIEWASGFFEGEGHARIRIHKKPTREYGYFILAIAQVFREPLDVFQEVVGCGNVTGPYQHGQKQPYYTYNVSGPKAAYAAEQMLPFLYGKKKQVQDALDAYKERLIDNS